jgi:hypothetical protein
VDGYDGTGLRSARSSPIGAKTPWILRSAAYRAVKPAGLGGPAGADGRSRAEPAGRVTEPTRKLQGEGAECRFGGTGERGGRTPPNSASARTTPFSRRIARQAARGPGLVKVVKGE